MPGFDQLLVVFLGESSSRRHVGYQHRPPQGGKCDLLPRWRAAREAQWEALEVGEKLGDITEITIEDASHMGVSINGGIPIAGWLSDSSG